jgi:alkanesulfonate monooxygenase SsuD/methylene tetrahydromethanopterin reductase-like flavin-dependent oxidoreductase (luciferase family)
MRFSVWPSPAQPWADILAIATHAEATGWDGIYVADHFMGDGQRAGDTIQPTFEATALLAGLATATSRVRLGSLVLGITYRHPAVLANWAKTVDAISGGRLLLGVGAGWQENEHEQYGIELGTPGVRIDRLEEALAVLEGLLRAPVTNVAGTHYRLTDAVMEPKPGRLPILIGAKGPRMMGVVARHADEWNAWSTPADFAERSAALDAACARNGRDPSSIARSTQALFFVGVEGAKLDSLVERAAPRAAVGGGAEQLGEAVRGWADAGVDEVIVPDFTLGFGAKKLEAYDLLIEQVAPSFRASPTA